MGFRFLHGRKPVEFIVDPSSRELSMSRFCLGLIVLIFWPVCIVAELIGFKISFWPQLVGLTVAVAGVYGVNSFGGAWGTSSWAMGTSDMGSLIPPVIPGIPKAKPAPGGNQ